VESIWKPTAKSLVRKDLSIFTLFVYEFAMFSAHLGGKKRRAGAKKTIGNPFELALSKHLHGDGGQPQKVWA